MSSNEDFYKVHHRLCFAFHTMVERRIMMIGRQEGYTNQSYPEGALRDVAAHVCEEVRRDIALQGVIMPDWMYAQVKDYVFHRMCDRSKSTWIVSK